MLLKKDLKIAHWIHKRAIPVYCALFLCLTLLTSCSTAAQEEPTETASASAATKETMEEPAAASDGETAAGEEDAAADAQESEPAPIPEEITVSTPTVTLDEIPPYTTDSAAYVVINDNTPFFTDEDYTLRQFEIYSKLDDLGRCGVAYANVCRDLMPMEERGDISQIRPSGWHNNPYDFIDGGYVYNRCHLIAYQLAGENANEKNLITGTRYMNISGMVPFENMVSDYIQETDGHVLYRVTPLFDGDNLVASGVLMEGRSVEDKGAGIEFCIYCYNVQPGVTIDYATGHNKADGTLGEVVDPATEEELEYIVNTNTLKFHLPDCEKAAQIQASNRKEVTAKRSELIDQGYEPCGVCKP